MSTRIAMALLLADVSVYFARDYTTRSLLLAREGTRLVARSRNRGGPHMITRPFAVLVGELRHCAMQARQFRNLRRRVAAHA